MGRPRVSRELERRFWRLIRGGSSVKAAARSAGVSLSVASGWFADGGGVPTIELTEPGGRYLSMSEREDIAVWREQQVPIREIGRRLGRDPATISREVRRNKSPSRPYRATVAQEFAEARARRPKPRRLAVYLPLRDHVQAKLKQRWSPQQISARLPADFPDDERMRISHEAIYQALYVQGRGGLRRELTACLRTGRALRRPQRRADERRERIKDKVMISERPAEVADRAVPGHWEGDLILGQNNKSAIGTLVERTTRFTMLLHLPDGHGATQVRDAITDTITTLPEALRRSLTWDQGIELAEHRQLTVAANLPVYFCDPHSPWQRGTNENTNGLLRQYFPKGTDLSVHTPQRLAEVADELNGRPRQTLGWRNPAEALAALLSDEPEPPGVATTG